METTESSAWYVVQQPTETCEILSAEAWQAIVKVSTERPQSWGPFASKEEAIARRVGLIRAGKCQPN